MVKVDVSYLRGLEFNFFGIYIYIYIYKYNYYIF